MKTAKTRVLVYLEFDKDPNSWVADDLEQAVYPRTAPTEMWVFHNLAAVDAARRAGKIQIPESQHVPPDLRVLGYAEGDKLPISCPHCGNGEVALFEERNSLIGTLWIAHPMCGRSGNLLLGYPNGTVVQWDSGELASCGEYRCNKCGNEFANFDIPPKASVAGITVDQYGG